MCRHRRLVNVLAHWLPLAVRPNRFGCWLWRTRCPHFEKQMININLSLGEILILTLATYEIIELWRHGSIFATWRARTQLWTGFFGTLLNCGFCLAPHVAVWLVCLWSLTSNVDDGTWQWGLSFLFRGIVLALAVARLANVCHDLMHAYTRSGRSDDGGIEWNHLNVEPVPWGPQDKEPTKQIRLGSNNERTDSEPNPFR